jgi:hypothetical protein
MAKTKREGPGALELLKEQHDGVRRAFRQFGKLDREDIESQQHLVQTTCEALKIHATLEEEMFYPAVREALEDEELVAEAEVEHETAWMLIEQLDNMAPDDPNFHATFIVLSEYVTHHLKEEEGELFPLVKKSGLELVELGGRMRQRLRELVGDTDLREAA